MKLKIELEMDNSAFGNTAESKGRESGRILGKYLPRIPLTVGEMVYLLDNDGRQVGFAKVTC